MRRDPPELPRLYRQKWMTMLREQAVGSHMLTPALVTDLWKFTRDQFLLRPEGERPLLSGPDGEPITDGSGRPCHVHFADVLTGNGLEFLEDLATAEIVRSDEAFLPALKIARKLKRAERKKLQEILNLTFDHPEDGRKRLGLWTPFDASRFVMPRITQQSLKLAGRGNEVSLLIARCDKADIPIVQQLNAEPDDPDGDDGDED